MKRSIPALFLIVAAACVPITPQPPQPPAKAAVLTVTIKAVDTGHTPAATIAHASDDFGHVWPCSIRIAEDTVGCELVGGPSPVPDGSIVGGGHLDITAPDYKPVHRDLGLTGHDATLPPAVLARSFVPLPRLVHRSDQALGLETGARHTVIRHSDFNLFARFLAGEDVEPLLEQRAAVGFNSLRVWTAYNVCPTGNGCQPIGRLVPSEHPTFGAQIRRFSQLAARHGLYISWTAFTGPYESLFPNDDAKVAHWGTLIAAVCAETNGSLELVNEFDQAANSNIPISRLGRPPAGCRASHGSNGSDAVPVRPPWDEEYYHTNGAPEWHRRAGHNCLEFSVGAENLPASHVPCIADENTRSDDQDGNMAHFYDAAAGAALLAGGATLHDIAGKNSVLWVGRQLEIAQAWVAGAKSVPLSCQDQPYRHRDDLEGSTYLRVYQRGDADACIVRIRP